MLLQRNILSYLLRLCYGSRGMKYYPDAKGILGYVRVHSKILRNWDMFPLDDKIFSAAFVRESRLQCNSTAGDLSGNGNQINDMQANGNQVDDIQANGNQENDIQANGNQVNDLQANGNQDGVVRNSDMFFTASFTVKHTADTFLNFDHWTKGQIFINSFNLGRYWNLKKGPQKTLYVPKSVLKSGVNHILIMELDKSPCGGEAADKCTVEFMDKPILI